MLRRTWCCPGSTACSRTRNGGLWVSTTGCARSTSRPTWTSSSSASTAAARPRPPSAASSASPSRPDRIPTTPSSHRAQRDKPLELLGLGLRLGEFPVLAASGAHLIPGTLYATLPPAEAFRRAAEAHPGLRVPPPEGGVLRECLRRHGLVAAWADLPALVPDLAPTAATAETI